jgi:receptor protein-tyrosine kinase
MSLIEQAAKRLQELQNSGVVVPAESAQAPAAEVTPPADRVPTPEAMVQELNVKSKSAKAPRREKTERSARSPEPEAPVRVAPHLPPEHVPVGPVIELDLERLKEEGFVTPDVPHSQIAHELRVLKRPIIRNAQGRTGANAPNGNLVMVTSSVPGEGKTFIAANLAISIAMEVDYSVLLVDGDVAHPSLPGVLGIPSSPGLLDVLTSDELDIDDVIRPTNVPKLSVLPAGGHHRQATELLASERMVGLTRELASRFRDRMIIFDSPPLLATTEARVLASHMGQIVMVVAADSTSKHVVKQALSTIERCELVQMLLNKTSKGKVQSYYGYYDYREPR